MTAAFIASADELARVPDGTVISWLRIPSDVTSEAVAFVRHETEQRTDPDGRPMAFGTEAPGETPGLMTTVWISPGGWDPLSIEEAGVNFPAIVIRWGEVTISEHPTTWHSAPLDWATVDSGGTWAREKALDAAARVRSGDAVNSQRFVEPSEVTDMAEHFEEWLNRPDRADSTPIDPMADPNWPPAYAQGYRDGGNSAAEDYRRVVEEARADAETQMDADLRDLLPMPGNTPARNTAALALALIRRGWVRIEPTE